MFVNINLDEPTSDAGTEEIFESPGILSVESSVRRREGHDQQSVQEHDIEQIFNSMEEIRLITENNKH